MMIDDDKREVGDGSLGNFKVIVDQKAEQDYAINHFKGSGYTPEALAETPTVADIPSAPQT